MARSARRGEQSEGDADFPDVNDLLKGGRRRAGALSASSASISKSAATSKPALELETAQNSGASRAIPRRNAATGSRELKTSQRAKLDGEDGDGGDEDDEISRAVEKSVKKKRVLAKRDDNPLLRPLGKGAKDGLRGGMPVGLEDEKGGVKIKAGKRTAVRKGAKAPVLKLDEDFSEKIGNVMGEENYDSFEKPSHGNPVPEPRQTKDTAPRVTKSSHSGPQTLSHASEAQIQEPTRVQEINDEMQHVSEQISQTSLDETQQSSNVLGETLDQTYRTQLQVLMEHPVMGGRGKRDDECGEIGFKEDRRGRMDGAEVITQELAPESMVGMGKGKAVVVTVDLDSDDEEIPERQELLKELRGVEAQRPRKHREPAPRKKSKFILTDTEEEDSAEEEGSDGMSDFIVSDNETLEDEDDDSVFEVPPPATRSARKLFRGRRPKLEDSEDESDLDLKMGRLRVGDEDGFGDVGAKKQESRGLDEASPKEQPTKSKGALEPTLKMKKKEPQPSSSDFEDPFTLR